MLIKRITLLAVIVTIGASPVYAFDKESISDELNDIIVESEFVEESPNGNDVEISVDNDILQDVEASDVERMLEDCDNLGKDEIAIVNLENLDYEDIADSSRETLLNDI